MPRVRPRRQMPERSAHAVVGAVEVRRDYVVEAVASFVVLPVRPAEAAAGDEPGDRAERAGGAREGTVDAATLPDVARVDMRRAVDARGRLAETLLAPREQRHRGAVARQPKRDRAPDSRPRTRDDDVLARHLTPLVRNLRGFRRQIPLQGRGAKRRLPLRRARDATRTKPSREAVRGSGRSAGEVDESAPGSANSWSDSF